MTVLVLHFTFFHTRFQPKYLLTCIILHTPYWEQALPFLWLYMFMALRFGFFDTRAAIHYKCCKSRPWCPMLSRHLSSCANNPPLVSHQRNNRQRRSNVEATNSIHEVRVYKPFQGCFLRREKRVVVLMVMMMIMMIAPKWMIGLYSVRIGFSKNSVQSGTL